MKTEILSPRQALNKALSLSGREVSSILTYKNDDRGVQYIGKWER
jgi:hypothetical protein